MEQLNCPWSELKPSTLQWCERQLCEWIREPANFWSNIFYIAFGLWIIYKARKGHSPHLGLIGIFSVLIGLMSGFYHASNSFFGEVLDFSCMFLISTYILCANLARRFSWSYERLRLVAFLVVITSIVLLVQFQSIGIELFALQLTTALVIEKQMLKLNKDKPHFNELAYSLICFGLAYISWYLDHEKIVCDPDRHWITGHAVWHFLAAVAIVFIYRFYSHFQIEEKHHA